MFKINKYQWLSTPCYIFTVFLQWNIKNWYLTPEPRKKISWNNKFYPKNLEEFLWESDSIGWHKSHILPNTHIPHLLHLFSWLEKFNFPPFSSISLEFWGNFSSLLNFFFLVNLLPCMIMRVMIKFYMPSFLVHVLLHTCTHFFFAFSWDIKRDVNVRFSFGCGTGRKRGINGDF